MSVLRRFVIGVSDLTAEQETKLRDYLSKLGGWWHWINNLWLLATPDESVDAETIRNFITKQNQKSRVVVFEFPEDIDWAATGSKNAKGRRIHEWISTTWAGENPSNSDDEDT